MQCNHMSNQHILEPHEAEDVEWIVDVKTKPVHITPNSNSTIVKGIEHVEEKKVTILKPDVSVNATIMENVTIDYDVPDDYEHGRLIVEYDGPLIMSRARPRSFRPVEEDRWELARENSWYMWVWYTSKEMINEECIVCTTLSTAMPVVVPERHSFRMCAEERKRKCRVREFFPS